MQQSKFTWKLGTEKQQQKKKIYMKKENTFRKDSELETLISVKIYSKKNFKNTTIRLSL